MKQQSNLIPQSVTSDYLTNEKVVVGPKSHSNTRVAKINRNGDVIESIEVECSCGETILIRCEYE